MEVFNCGPAQLPTSLVTLSSLLLIVVKIIVPVILMILGILDFTKGITASKDDDLKKVYITFFKRALSAVLLFFVVEITQFTFSLVSDEEDKNALSCINCFVNGLENGKCETTISTK